MKYLGIDWGTKYIGLSISDEEHKFSFPYDILENKNVAYVQEKILEIITKEKISKIVIGMPYKLSGKKSYAMVEVKNFVEELKKKPSFKKIKFDFFDERLTTKFVEKELLIAKKKRKDKKAIINKASAQKILQDYLDCKNSQKPRTDL